MHSPVFDRFLGTLSSVPDSLKRDLLDLEHYIALKADFLSFVAVAWNLY